MRWVKYEETVEEQGNRSALNKKSKSQKLIYSLQFLAVSYKGRKIYRRSKLTSLGVLISGADLDVIRQNAIMEKYCF